MKRVKKDWSAFVGKTLTRINKRGSLDEIVFFYEFNNNRQCLAYIHIVLYGNAYSAVEYGVLYTTQATTLAFIKGYNENDLTFLAKYGCARNIVEGALKDTAFGKALTLLQRGNK